MGGSNSRGASLPKALCLSMLGAFLALALACGGDSTEDVDVPSVAQLVKPGFVAETESGVQVPVAGLPEMIVEWEGRAKVRLSHETGVRYLDLLAIESELVGEHPSQKVERLHRRLGVPLDRDVLRKLQDPVGARTLFHRITFEYRPGRETTGTISEVFPDGSFLVIPDRIPDEWRSAKPGTSGPTHFLVDAVTLVSGTSQIAREYEEEILALPFELQREPPAHLAPKMCEIYREAVSSRAYQDLLTSIGFLPNVPGPDANNGGGSLMEMVGQASAAPHGRDSTFFGTNRYWREARLQSLGVEGLRDCDQVRATRKAGEEVYHLIWRPQEPDRERRNLVIRTDPSMRNPEVVYVAPGAILTAMPIRREDSTYLLLSTEGWPDPSDGGSADPRWQSVYTVDVDDPDSYQLVQYPLPTDTETNRPEHLYSHSPYLTGDDGYLFSVLYGFEEQGGGLWVADVSGGEFAQYPEGFAKVVPWDHALTWMVIGQPPSSGERGSMSILLTGKEVADDFAMTVNYLTIDFQGLQSTVESKTRLLRMVGWNPVPFARQRLTDGRQRVLIYAHYSYENSLLDRAKGVYIVTVDE